MELSQRSVVLQDSGDYRMVRVLMPDSMAPVESQSFQMELFVADVKIRKITEDGTVTTQLNKRNSGMTMAIRYKIEWTPSLHSLFPLPVKKQVMTMLMISAKKQDGTPW